MKNSACLVEHVLAPAKKNPEKVALDTGLETISYGQLSEKVKRATRFCRSQGLAERELVALCFQDELSLILAALGVAAMGASIVVVRRSMLSSFASGLHADLGVTAILTDQPEIAPANIRCIPFGRDSGLSEQEWSTRESAETAIPRQKVEYKRFATIVGSGSTGKPKVFTVSHLQEIAYIQSRVAAYGMTDHDKVATSTHIEFTSARRHVLAAFSAGCTVRLYPKDKRASYIDLVHSDLSIFHVPVLGLHQLLQGFSGKHSIFPNLRILGAGGSLVSHSLREEVHQKISKHLHVVYGTNEMGYLTVAQPEHWIGRPGVIGLPLPGVEVQVVDSSGVILREGQPGLLRVRKLHMVTEYWRNVAATKKFFRDGWFYPMDICSWEKDGLLKFYGRADDLMIFNGINIYPAEIEAVLGSFSGVKDVAAFPLFHDVYQDVPACAIVLDPSNETDLASIATASKRLLGTSAPHRIFVLDSIPRDEQGKLIRPKLRDYLKAKPRFI